MNEQIIGTQDWWNAPLGRYMLAWEQTCYDDAVADVFGFRSLQMGLFALAGLRANRMPHRWLALGSPAEQAQAAAAGAGGAAAPAALLCAAHALPFAADALDLVLLPHTLELSADPHAVLREVARVLMPEGRLLISGINPASLWGMHTWSRRIPGLQKLPSMPDDRSLIGYGRLRDWLRLLGLELQSASFGCFRPALRSAHWLARWQWLDTVGPAAWPILGGVYFVEAVKKTPGMRVLPAPWENAVPAAALRPAAAREGCSATMGRRHD